MKPRGAFPRICIALGCRDGGQLARLATEAFENGEAFLEIRLDLLDEPAGGIPVIRRLAEEHPELRLMATCRRLQNGGGFRGSIEKEFDVLEAAVGAGAWAVDVEMESAQEAPARLKTLREQARLVVSYHNFEETPPLAPVLSRLHKTEADVYKLVTAARKPTDNFRLLQLHSAPRGRPLVALAMGEIGTASRVLALSRHSPFTYASPAFHPACHESPGTAPGQVPCWMLRRLYHAEQRSLSTAVYGVIADPVSHSLSPQVHNRAFQARRIDAVYLPFLVAPAHLRDFMELAVRLPVAGFSVTLPHKQKIIRHLDGIDPLARSIGAVNTVYRRHGKLRGTNTDAAGLTVPLEKRLRLKEAKVLVVGTGGAARGAIFALAGKGARVFVTGRTPAHVRTLARAAGAVALEPKTAEAGAFDVMVHATPLGMFPRTEESYFTDRIPASIVFDMVYNPCETMLLRQAKAAGKQVISGLEMFLEQAALQHEIWTGGSAPRLAMASTAREALQPAAHLDRD